MGIKCAAILLLALVVAAIANDTDDTRIVGGKNAYDGQFPWMVAVRHSQTFICGGALVHHLWVLTTAECVWEYEGTEDRYSIFVGGTSILSTSQPGRQELFVAKVYAHPDFNMNRDSLYFNNIGMMFLATPAPITIGLIQTIPIAPRGSIQPTGLSATLSGWGGTTARVSPDLQWANMVTMNGDECSQYVGHEMNQTQVCTRGYPNEAACWYDHGSPLVIASGPSAIWTVIGVTAYAGCMDPVHPTIYSNPSYSTNANFINGITGLPLV